MDSLYTDAAQTVDDMFSNPWTGEMELQQFQIPYLFSNHFDNRLIENASVDKFTDMFGSATSPQAMTLHANSGAAAATSAKILEDDPISQPRFPILGNAQPDNSSPSFASISPTISFNVGNLQKHPIQQMASLVHGDIQAACVHALYSGILTRGGSSARGQQSFTAPSPPATIHSNKYNHENSTVMRQARGGPTPCSKTDRGNPNAVGFPNLSSTPVKSYNGLNRRWPPNHVLQIATPVHYINDQHVGEPKEPKRYLSEVSSNATATPHAGSVALDSMSRMVVGLESQPTKRCYMHRVLSTTFKIETVRKIPICSVCGKKFPSISHLKVHYRSYTKERPFKCTICGRRFSTEGNKKVHVIDKHVTPYDQQRPTGFSADSTVHATSIPGIKRSI